MNRYRYGKRLYGIWVGMRARCYRKTHQAYSRYGARDIKVCDEWHDYSPFALWALANNYSDELTIERKDVNGDYCPENCCWITRGDQARNRRNNRKIFYNGISKTGAEWARDLGFRDKHIILNRIDRGWSVEKSLTTPSRNHVSNAKKARSSF